MRISRANFLSASADRKEELNNAGESPARSVERIVREDLARRFDQTFGRDPYSMQPAAPVGYQAGYQPEAARPVEPSREMVRQQAPQPEQPMPVAAARNAAPSVSMPGGVPGRELPTWQSAFTLAENVRFTRTPESELAKRRQPAEPPEPPKVEPVRVPGQPSPRALIVPPRNPPPAPQVRGPAAAASAPNPVPQNVAAASVTTAAPAAVAANPVVAAPVATAVPVAAAVAAPSADVAAQPAAVEAPVPAEAAAQFAYVPDHVFWATLELAGELNLAPAPAAPANPTASEGVAEAPRTPPQPIASLFRAYEWRRPRHPVEVVRFTPPAAAAEIATVQMAAHVAPPVIVPVATVLQTAVSSPIVQTPIAQAAVVQPAAPMPVNTPVQQTVADPAPEQTATPVVAGAVMPVEVPVAAPVTEPAATLVQPSEAAPTPVAAPVASIAPAVMPVTAATVVAMTAQQKPTVTERLIEASQVLLDERNARQELEAAAEAASEPVAEASRVTIVLPAVEQPERPLAPSRVSRLPRFSPLQPDYEYPSTEFLQVPGAREEVAFTQEQLEQNAGLLESVLEDFGVKGEIIHVRPGPVVTLYEFEPAPGVKSSRVIGLADDIARSMSALSARVAVVPGRNVIGIELPNAVRETVFFREMIESEDYENTKCKLALCLGKTIGGEPVIAELAKMPHLLVAGTTGSGKSVAVNTMILSLLYRLRPEECRLIMVDPKMLELSIYDGIPHLLTPVVTDPKKAVMALKWAVREMEERYKKMSRLGVRNIDGFNSRVRSAKERGETVICTVQTGFDKETGEATYEQEEMDLTPMPYIVVIVDEMADLMMVAGKEIEGAIQRLAQMARAAGIHLIMATQRPSVDVITGTIKANFPTRISFQVTSKIDSRTILGEQGAEQLLGQGDMLHMAGGGRIARVHGAFVSDEEVERIVAHLKTQGRPDYLNTVTAAEEEEEEPAADSGAVFDKGNVASEDGNELYEQAVKVVMRDKKCSTSYIQRRLQIGYNRAASLVERMEKEGLVGPANHVGKREIISADND